MIKKILIGIVGLVLLLVAVSFALPRTVHVERTTLIEAPPATVFALVNGYKKFNEWSPWAGLDPDARYTYEGPAFGVGATLSWAGDPKKVGAGTQRVVESRPHELVRVALDFGDQGQGESRFMLAREGTATRVVWGFDTDLGMNPLSRWFGLMMDGMIGPDYERGLAGLKRVAENLPDADFADLAVEHTDVEPVTVAYVPAKCGANEQEIASTIGASYAQIGKFMAAHKLQLVAAPITINNKWDAAGYEFDAAIPIDHLPEKPVPADSVVQVKQTYAGPVLRVAHKGAYREMPETYNKLMAYVAAHGYEAAGPPWDEYVSDPGSTPEPELVTVIYMPVK